MDRGVQAGDRVRMTIETVAFGGDGVGRPAGLATFVPFTVDGDEIVAEITERRGRYARAVPREILVPSPHRVEPPCPYYGRCGGCSLQHVRYGHQLVLKERHVADAFIRIGRFPDPPLRPAVPSPRAFSYRGRAELHLQYGGGREPVVGFMERASHDLLDVDRCLLLADSVNEALGRLRRSLGEQTGGPHRRGERLLWSDPDPSCLPGGNLPASSRGRVLRIVRGTVLAVPSRGFFQANELLTDALVDCVLEMAAPAGTDTVLDAYSGSGLFTRFLAPRAGSVIGIEHDRAAVACARDNLRAAGFPGVRFFSGDVAEGLRELRAGGGRRINTAVLDPPRAGCGPEVMELLAGLESGRVVYVSCDPATQARDARLLAARGYSIEALQPLDMFPQTSHVETVALLEKS
jgi:23S rRNA (uracil1939-C5)-methyltransferase